MKRRTFALTGVYLAAIVAANLLVAKFGPGVSILNAFLFIGLDLSTRDQLHEEWGGRYLLPKMAALIGTGAALSYALNRNAGPIAFASFAAFGLAAIADGVVFQALRRKSWFQRSNVSNIAGAAVDSVVFPTLAFGGLLPLVTLGQFAAKVGGGFLWSSLLVLLRRRQAVAA